MNTLSDFNKQAAYVLGQTLTSLGMDDHRKLDITLRVARKSSLCAHPEDCSDLWTALFVRLAQTTSLGRSGLGELLTKKAFADRASLKISDVERLRKEGRIVALAEASSRRYPAFQAWNGRLLEGIEDVNLATAQAGHNDYTRTVVLVWPVVGGASILEALRSGLISEGIEMAKAFRGFLL